MADRYDDTLILGYLEGDLPDADRARLEQQMSKDPALAALVERMRDDRAAMRRLPTEEPPMGLADAAMSLEERSMLLGDPDPAAPRAADPAGEEVRRFRLHRTASYLAIAALVVICGGVVLVSLTDPWPESGTRWLSDKGIAMGGEESAATLALEKSDAAAAVSGPEALPASEELLADMIKERRVDATEPLGAIVEATEPIAADADAVAGASMEEAERRVGITRPRVEPPISERRTEALATAPPIPAAAMKADQPKFKGGAALARTATPARKVSDRLPGSAGQPRGQTQRVNTVVVDVDTEDARRTRAEVADWAVSNYAVIEQPAVEADALFAAPDPATEDAPANGKLTVLVDERQVPQLLSRLNEWPGQRANLVDHQPYRNPLQSELKETVTVALDELRRFSDDSIPAEVDEAAGERSSAVGWTLFHRPRSERRVSKHPKA